MIQIQILKTIKLSKLFLSFRYQLIARSNSGSSPFWTFGCRGCLVFIKVTPTDMLPIPPCFIMKAERNLLFDTQKIKCSYYGHIKRGNNILTTAVEGKIQDRRPRGRSRNNWFGNVKEWAQDGTYKCTSKAIDCNIWGAFARRLSKKTWHFQVIQDPILVGA